MNSNTLSDVPLKSNRTIGFRTVLLSACAAMSFSQIAHAQQTPTGEAGKSEADIIVNATRAVTATKTDTPLIQVPQSITVVTSQQILDQGALTLLQATNFSAGVYNNGDDTRGDFVQIRGFWAVNYLDGLKREFGFVYIPRSETYTLERVDLLMGPAAVLYGAGSSGGLVNMQTKRPQFEFAGEVGVSYGTFDRKQAQFDITGPLSDTVAVRLVGLYRDADMLLRGIPDDRRVIQPSITFKPSESTEISLLGLYHKDITGPSAYMPLAATLYAQPGQRMNRRTLLGEPNVNRGPKEDMWLTLTVDHQFSDALKFHSSSRYEKDKTSYGEIYGVYFLNPTDPYLNAEDSVIPRSIFAIKAKYRTFQTDNNLQFDFETGPFTHKILAGVDYSYFRQLSRQAFAYLGATPIDIYNPVYGAPGNTPVYDPQLRQVLKNIGFYAQDQIRFMDRASLVVGFRHDDLKTYNTGDPVKKDKATTFRVGLTVDVTKGVAPYFSYSESFQPVSGLNQFNQFFVPLTARSYEGGVKIEPAPGAMIRLTYYDILEDNHIVPDPNQPLNSIQAGTVKSKGFEVQGNYNVAENFTLSVAYSHNSTKVSGEDRQQEGTPKDTASIFGTKTFPLGDEMSLRIGGGVRYMGRQYSGDPAFFQVTTPSFTLVDAIAAIDYRSWTLQVNARNLLDKYYYANCLQWGSCANGDPRTINAALTYRF